jgi:MFS transporter
MASDHLPNRWGIAVAAVIMQICLGAVYGWSVFVKPLIGAEHWKLTDVSLNFTLAIVFLGFGTVIGGLWQDRVGPRKVASVAGILYGIGYLVAGFAASRHSLPGLYLGYGVITGIGMGMGYICPVATLVKWFPDRRGLMTGVAVCGYGFGALIMSPFAAWESIHHGDCDCDAGIAGPAANCAAPVEVAICCAGRGGWDRLSGSPTLSYGQCLRLRLRGTTRG